MLPFAYYILKVIICSTVLFGYYWFFLRNKIFHSYNRFYLLATVVLSLTLPLLKFNVWQKTDAPKTGVVQMLQVVNSSDEYMDEIIIQSHYNHISKETVVMWLFIGISFVFAVMHIITLCKIHSLKKNNPQEQLAGINLIHTSDKKTPFSFFKNIFWNNEIEINSNNGKRILKHEIAHVQEKHSHDKLFINIVLIFCWSNPVFWLIRKELNMIHEFIADKKAIEDGDTAAFAAMILQSTYPGHRFELTNNFFYSPIKRRLSMLTKNKTKVSYISRLLVLPLTVVVFAAFTLKAKTYIESLPNNDKIVTVVIDAGHGGTDNGATTPEGILEKDLTLSLAKKIQELNKSSNLKILLTRETDIYQDPKAKAALANKLGADLFISLHVNNAPASGDEKQTGMTVWVARDEFKNKDASELLAGSIISAFHNNYLLRVPANPSQSRHGIAVLEQSTCASVLIEAGFISNKKDLAYLLSTDGQDQFAKNILNAVFSYETTLGNDKVIRSAYQKNPLKSTSKTFAPGDINIGPGVPKTSLTVSANNKLLKEGIDYTIDYNEGIIKMMNKTIIDNNIPVQVDFYNVSVSTPDTTPNFKSLLQKIRSDRFIDASQYVTLTDKKKENFSALTKLSSSKEMPQPLIIINGEESTIKKLNDIDKDDFQFIRVLKPETAIPVYGQKAKQGAIIVNVKTTYTLGTHVSTYDLDHSNFTVGDLTSSLVSAAEFKMQKTIKVSPGYKYISSTVYFAGTGFDKPGIAVLNTTSLSSMASLMKQCVNGSSITFDNIKVEDEQGHTLFIQTKSFILQDDGPDQKSPSVNLSGITNTYINISRLGEIKELKFSDENYKIASATVYFSGNGFPAVRMASLYEGSLKTLANDMNKIVAGSLITFDNIHIVKKNGSDEMEIDGRSFEFYDDNLPVIDPDTLHNKVFTKVEQEAEFPGGKDAWQVYLRKNLNAGTPVDEGWKPGSYKIIVNFVVNKEGNVSDVSSDDFINSKTAQQCMNLIKNGPKWIPAKQNGKIVSSYRKQPITFVVSEN